MQPSVVGQTYQLQPDTYSAQTPVYLRSDTADVYLYYDTDRWTFSSEYLGGTTYAYVIDAAETPQNVSAMWVIKDGGSFVVAKNLTAGCTGRILVKAFVSFLCVFSMAIFYYNFDYLLIWGNAKLGVAIV